MTKYVETCLILGVMVLCNTLIAPSYAAIPSATPANPITHTSKAVPAPKGKKLVAHVAWVKGIFTANEAHNSVARTLQSSSNIYLNDMLQTGKNSIALIVFTDDTVMTLRADTKIFINQYNYSPTENKSGGSKSPGQYIIGLITGGFRTITGFIAKDAHNHYEVNTPVATIGVRGTQYSAVNMNDKTYVKRYDGSPSIASNKENHRNDKITLHLDDKNKYASASKGEDPTFLADEPEVFRTDVDIIPLTYSDDGRGFCGSKGCGTKPSPAPKTNKPYISDLLNKLLH